MAMDDILNELARRIEWRKQIILYGPPGTGKTFTAKRLAYKLITKKDPPKNLDDFKREINKLIKHKKLTIVQFHPSYNYEDFVRGIEVTTSKGDLKVVYQVKNKIFAEICELAKNFQDKKFVLIIDEINRANLPAVFGELIYALEYRGEPVDIPYEINNSRALVVPNNLYIIGTMNTADRSAGRIDYAIRRRFDFYALHADSNAVNTLIGKKLMKEVNKFVENNVFPDYDAEDIKIGHTYFISDFLIPLIDFLINKPDINLWRFQTSDQNETLCITSGVFAAQKDFPKECQEGDLAILFNYKSRKLYGLWKIDKVPRDEDGRFILDNFLHEIGGSWNDKGSYPYQVKVSLLPWLNTPIESDNPPEIFQKHHKFKLKDVIKDIYKTFMTNNQILDKLLHNFLNQVVPLLYEYIVDGLLNVKREENKGYPITLFGQTFYIKGGVLYKEDMKKVTEDDLLNLLLNVK